MRLHPKIMAGLCYLTFVMQVAYADTINTTALDQFSSLATDYETAYFQHFPEMGAFWGRDHTSQDRFTDHSFGAERAWQQQEDAFLAKLNTFDEKTLNDSPLHITYQLLKETLKNNQAARICKESLWNVNPLEGWHIITTAIAEKQQVGTPESRALALKRWHTFGWLVNEEIAHLKKGLKLGYTAPKPAVQRVLTQIKIILNTPIDDSPYFDFAKRDGDPVFMTQIHQLIETNINPTLQRYVDFLENDYLPAARETIGVSALPNGLQCYQAKVKQMTTLAIDPEAIYDYGQKHMIDLNNEVATIGLREFGTQNMAQIFNQAKTDPAYWFHSENDILDYNFAALARVTEKLSTWFSTLPTTKGTIKPFPIYRAKTGAGGEYVPPSIDGTEPGIYYINTDEPSKKSRVDQEATLFHELIPGHHFQVALTYEDKSHHSLDKYLWNSGYGEGWALYVERLADEMGVYTDDISRLGMLSNETLRTARLVVDPGMHVFHWTREKAVTYLKEHTALSDSIIEGEIDRYIMNPGQATAYMLGKRQIEVLRDLAHDDLKDNFDIREFHTQVLKNGAITLPMLESQIKNWLGSRAK